MVVFISLSEYERIKFFKELKKSINISWDKFYPKYNISRTMFFNYLSGRYGIPKNLFDKWIKLVNIRINNINKFEKQKYLLKSLSKVKVDKKLAEIFGALNGDGHISNFQYEINIVGDSKEKAYMIHLKNLFEKKFGISFTFFEEPNRIKLRTYSKELSNYLINKHNFPKGRKKGKLKVPEIIKKSREFKKSYLRGLFDTDGTIYVRRKNDLVIEISNVDRRFRKEVANILADLGFLASLNKRHISIYQQKQIHKFFKIIKPANPKHLKKYKLYSKQAWVV